MCYVLGARDILHTNQTISVDSAEKVREHRRISSQVSINIFAALTKDFCINKKVLKDVENTVMKLAWN